MISLKEIKDVRYGDPDEMGAALSRIIEREEALTDTCPVCQGTGGYWTDEWQEDKYCSGLGVVTGERGYGA